MARDPLIEQLLAGFVLEAKDLVESATRCILGIERAAAGSPELASLYEQLGRDLHTLKGSSATLGLEETAELAHDMEEAIVGGRSGLRPLAHEPADALLQALDGAMLQLRAHAEKREPPDCSAIVARLRSLPPGGMPAEGPGPSNAGAESVAPREEPTAALPDPDQPGTTWRLAASDIQAMAREIEGLRQNRLNLERRRREVRSAIDLLEHVERSRHSEELRRTLNRVERGLASDGDSAAASVSAFDDVVRSICTLPVSTVLEPLHRAVRDLSRAGGKRARLAVVGGDIALDRRLLDGIRGPLVHLVRNAVDHGIEPPEERELRGKQQEGVVSVRIEQQGNLVFIEVADDGAGLDLSRIREVALSRGVVTAEALRAMSDLQVRQLIFRPGFSTARAVTETSGRGIGLDVVESDIEALEGQVEVESIAQQGSRFILSIPTEIGSASVLLVRCAEHQLGIPLFAVERLQQARLADLQVGRSQVRLVLADEVIPIRDLGAMLGLRQPQPPYEGQPLVIARGQGVRAALAVDELLGDRDLVIRPLPPALRALLAYRGAGTLARGENLLILRPEWLLDERNHPDEASSRAQRLALVVDDSLTARALHRSILEAGGFTVHAVGSAEQALRQLRAAAYDVLVCDVGLGDVDGLTLTRQLRAGSGANLPVVLVSAKDQPADRERGLASGADAYLSKQECAAGRLLSVVRSAIEHRRTHG